MNLKSSTILLVFLMLGNSLNAMGTEADCSDDELSATLSEEETTQDESFWAAQLSGARALLGFGATAATDFYHNAQNYLNYRSTNKQLAEAFKYLWSDQLKELLNNPCADIQYVDGLTPLWLELRLKVKKIIKSESDTDSRDGRRVSACLKVVQDHEAKLRKMNLLTIVDEFIRAVADQDNEKVRRMLGMEALDINGRDRTGYTALHVAILVGNMSCIPLLCDHPDFDANSELRCRDATNCPSYSSCALLEISADRLEISADRQGPEAAAALCSLAERGATISLTSIVHAYIRSILDSRSVEMTINDYFRNHTIYMALGVDKTFYNFPSPEAIEAIPEEQRSYRATHFLLRALLNEQTLRHMAPMSENVACCCMWAVEGEKFRSFGENQPVDTDVLPIDGIYNNWANFDAQRSNYVSKEGLSFKEFVKAQLRNNWDDQPSAVNHRDFLLMTPLMWAAARGNLELAQFLVEFPALDLAEVNAFCGVSAIPGFPALPLGSFSALHFAIRNGHTDLVRFLIELPGAHRTQKTQSGRSPYQLAQSCKQTEVIAFLDDRNKRRLHLLMCLLVKTLLVPDTRKRIVSELRF